MGLSIRTKLLLSLLLTAGLVLLTNYTVGRQQLRSGFLEFVNSLEAERYGPLANALEALYETEGSFAGLKGNRRRWPALLAQFQLLRDPEGRPPGPRPMGPPGFPARPEARLPELALVDADGRTVIGPPMGADSAALPLVHDGMPIGTLRFRPIPGLEMLGESAAGLFLAQQQQALLITLLTALGFAALMAWFVARRFERPLRALGAGAEQLSRGNYGARLTLATGDEFEALAAAFNQLGGELEAEAERRAAWLMDVSHELRTPVAILKSEVEALQDGVRAWSPAQADSLEAELRRLERLLDDFHETTTRGSDQHGGAVEPLDLGHLLRTELQRFEVRLDAIPLATTLELPYEPLPLLGNAERLSLLLRNVLENSARYTDGPGRLTISAGSAPDRVWCCVADSAPGVAEELLPRLTERFFRAERSRSRATGGSGLGLALCQRVVTEHNGTLTFSPSPLGGLKVDVSFPRA
ncbi:MAG: ATP-binding protein [Pseudomonadota bacterium]